MPVLTDYSFRYRQLLNDGTKLEPTGWVKCSPSNAVDLGDTINLILPDVSIKAGDLEWRNDLTLETRLSEVDYVSSTSVIDATPKAGFTGEFQVIGPLDSVDLLPDGGDARYGYRILNTDVNSPNNGLWEVWAYEIGPAAWFNWGPRMGIPGINGTGIQGPPGMDGIAVFTTNGIGGKAEYNPETKTLNIPGIPMPENVEIVQESGSSTTVVMSQKAVTDLVNTVESGNTGAWPGFEEEYFTFTPYTTSKATNYKNFLGLWWNIDKQRKPSNDNSYAPDYTITINSNGTATINANPQLADGQGELIYVAVSQSVIVPPNTAPTANAGADQSLTGNATTLSGSGTDSDGTIASYSWSLINGAGTIASPNAATTNVTGLGTGSNVFRLTVTDNNGAIATDDVTIQVSSTNAAPVANAGPDQTITLPTNSVALSGTASDSDGTIASTVWSKVSGPAGDTLTNASTLNATASNLLEGTYEYLLTVTDNGGAVSTDSKIVTVNPKTAFVSYSETFESYLPGTAPSGWVVSGATVQSSNLLGSVRALRFSNNLSTVLYAYYDIVTPNPNYRTEVRFIKNNTAYVNWGLTIRSSGNTYNTNNSMYRFNVIMNPPSGNPSMSLTKFIGGVATNLIVLDAIVFPNLTGINIILSTIGNVITVSAQRISDGQWFTSTGAWQATQAPFISVTDNGITAAGYSGLYYYTGSSSPDVFFDDFKILPNQ